MTDRPTPPPSETSTDAGSTSDGTVLDDEEIAADEAAGTPNDPEWSATEAAVNTSKRRWKNRSTAGRLVIHFTVRDVGFDIDGLTAIGVMSDWQHRPDRLPQIDPKYASAEFTWIGIDLAAVLGLTWHPRRDDVEAGSTDRLAVDPD